MPGPAGGGRSIGGSRGGGFSGGSRGGFSGGSRSSGFSGNFRSLSGSNHTYRHVGGTSGMNTGNQNSDDEKSGKKIGLIIIALFMLVTFAGPAAGFVSNTISSINATPDIWEVVESVLDESEALEDPFDGYYITPVEGERTKLDASLCTPVDVWFEDEADFLLSDSEQPHLMNELTDGLAYFYEKTGVQPYLLIVPDVYGDENPDWDVVNRYLTKRYIDLFGEDEGHYIALIIAQEDASYTFWYIPGLDAMQVMDENASYILTDFLYMHYVEAANRSAMFAQAFIDTADYIMTGALTAEGESAVVYTTQSDDMTFENTTMVDDSALPALTQPPVVPGYETQEDVVIESVPVTQEVVVIESFSATQEDSIIETVPATQDVTEQEPTDNTAISKTIRNVALLIIVCIVGAFLIAALVLHDKKQTKDLEKMS
ncbi:MAG: TPM domain-containing protein [Clostridia bacterium]|nr:TPM domain-containing protein [Clostridia bacterium]